MERLLRIQVDSSWPAPDLREILLGYAEALDEDPSLLGWGLWLILDGRGRKLVGDVGFKGPPDLEGSIEIGYGIAEPYRRRGLVTEAIRTLLRWAWAQPGVKRITARCYAVNAASIAVLEKLGFQRTGEDFGILEWTLRSEAEEDQSPGE